MKSTEPYLRVGVTGGIGSGKSTVCRSFEQLGRVVLSADEIARSLTDTDPHIKASIRKRFGSAVFLPDGTVDRRALARIVFTSPAKLNALNAMIHPRVFDEIERRLEDLPPERKRPYVIIEAALIFESGMDKHLDYVIVVHADENERIARVMRRDGLTQDEVRARMKSQMNVARALRRADFIITNSGPLDELADRVAFLDAVLSKLPRS